MREFLIAAGLPREGEEKEEGEEEGAEVGGSL